MRIAIIGSRNITDYEALKAIMATYEQQTELIISGGAKGADQLAEKYAEEYKLPIEIILPDYQLYKKTATHIRNNQIIEKADLIIALWDGKSKGTLSVIKKAKKQFKKLIIKNFAETQQIDLF